MRWWDLANAGRSLPLAVAALAIALAGCGNGLEVPPGGGLSQDRSSDGAARAVWGMPADGKRPNGVVMIIHGGGWAGPNPTAFAASQATAPVYQRAGYATVTVEYREGALGLRDVQRFYEQARKRYGPDMPICAIGPSAGGHIAMMLAVWNPDLSCVINLAGPANLITLDEQTQGEAGGKLAEEAFGGDDDFERFSPALHADSICAEVLLIFAENDPIVPVEQGYEMSDALPSAELIVLPPGDTQFVHAAPGGGPDSGVDPEAKAQASAQQVQFLTSATSQPPPQCDR